MQFVRLDRMDGGFVMVAAPVFSRAAEVRAYHLELLNEVRQFQGYQALSGDAVLFAHYQGYYQAIADRLNPTVDVFTLTPVSRHRFFIATGTKGAIGLSQLETLMGYRLPEPEEPEPQISLTSGDAECDLMAAILLCFKGSAVELTDRYSTTELVNILQQAQNLMRSEEALKELQQAQDRALFEQNAAQINQQIQALGGAMPF